MREFIAYLTPRDYLALAIDGVILAGIVAIAYSFLTG